MSDPVCLGTDFDNTIVSYDHLFRSATEATGVEVPGNVNEKAGLRSFLRSRPGGEILWQKVQAEVYGRRMEDARMLAGFRETVMDCRRRNVQIFVISHKTRYAEQDQTLNLRSAALGWMEEQGFFDSHGLGFNREDIFFEATRQEKVSRLGELGCTHFIDDLPEVLSDPDFPKGVARILYSGVETNFDGKRVSSWSEVSALLFG